VRGAVDIGSVPNDLSFVPGTSRALIVGSTRWVGHLPSTRIVDVDYSSITAKAVDVPNCAAPIEVLPDGSRALLSPTFCEEDKPSTGRSNGPIPIGQRHRPRSGRASVPPKLARLRAGGARPEGGRAVAYLDVQRMDEAMFEDKSKIPESHGCTLPSDDHRAERARLRPFADRRRPSAFCHGRRPENALLVDATVQRFRGDVNVNATIDASGKVTVKLNLFGKGQALFGTFDLGPARTLRLEAPPPRSTGSCKMGDGKRVFTLKMTADGLGGDLYRIDLDTRSATSLGKSLRDIGVLADGKHAGPPRALAAVQVKTSAGVDWYRHERFCFSSDGVDCSDFVEYQDSKPFQSGPACTDYHDC